MKDTTFKKPNILEYVDQKMKEGYSEDEALFMYDVEFSDIWEYTYPGERDI